MRSHEKRLLLYDSVRDEEREMDGSQVGSEREVGLGCAFSWSPKPNSAGIRLNGALFQPVFRGGVKVLNS